MSRSQRLFGAMLVPLAVLAGCGPKPAPVMASADLAQSYRLVLGPGPEKLEVDRGNPNSTILTGIPLSPIGLIVVAATTAVSAGIAAQQQSSRAARSQALDTALALDATFAGEFDRRFRAALTTQMERSVLKTDGLEDADQNRFAEVARAHPGTPDLLMLSDAVFTLDGRALVGRATMRQRRAGVAESPAAFVQRSFVAFSDILEPMPPEQAATAWRADDQALLRRQIDKIADELAALISAALSVPEPGPAPTRQLKVNTPGVAVLSGIRSDIGERWVGTYLHDRQGATYLRLQNDRAHLFAWLGRDFDAAVWLSVPSVTVEGLSPS